MTFNTSLIITGDSKVAQAAVEDLKKSVDALGNSTRGTAGAQGAAKAVQDAATASARAGAVAQGAVAAANDVAAVSSRAAAVAQGALTVATNAGSAAMGAFGISAMTVEAILTGGLSLAITAGVAFLTGFAGEMFTAGDAADEAAGKVDRMTKSVEALIKANSRLTAQQLADGDIKLRQMEGRLATVDSRLSGAARRSGMGSSGTNLIELQREREELEAQIFDLRPVVAGNRMRWERQQAMDAADAAGRSGGSTRSSGTAAARGNDDLAQSAREAAQAQKKLQSELDAVIGRYDPARKAASDYADELARIARLSNPEQRGGPKISAEQASDYRAQARAAYLGKAIDWGSINAAANTERETIDNTRNARDAVDDLVQSLSDETDVLRGLDPVQQVMIRYRKQLAALAPEEQAAAARRIADAEAAKGAMQDQADAARDAQRAQQWLASSAIDAFTSIVVGGQKAGDVVKRLGQALAAAALEATVFGTGPLAALLNGSTGAGGNRQVSLPGTGAIIDLPMADAVGKSVGKSVSEAMDKVFGNKGSFGLVLRNAGLGSVAGGIAGNSTAGALGGILGGAAGKELLGGIAGAIGEFAGPFGAIAGGVLGGLLGGLFKKAKWGTAVLTGGASSDVTLYGNNSTREKAASGLAGNVQDALAQIGDQFGGSVGGFNTSIGLYKDKYRVSTTGGTKLGGYSGSESQNEARYGLYNFGDDQAAAIAFAVQDAIKDGAINGLSEAVQKALKSNTDINKSIAEALKVQDVELALGGIGAELQKQFREFEAQARERVRIATQYGFDVVAIEKRNAEDRAKLTDQMLQEQVGSLQKLIDEMTQGSLFEGSAVDQRTALLSAIGKAKSDLDAGKDGAADTLAGLYQQLNDVSKDAYGTTGQFAADRSMILDQARAAIARSNAQIVAASQAVSDPALTTTNQALDENNDQNARMISLLETIQANTARTSLSTSSVLDAAALARTS